MNDNGRGRAWVLCFSILVAGQMHVAVAQNYRVTATKFNLSSQSNETIPPGGYVAIDLGRASDVKHLTNSAKVLLVDPNGKAVRWTAGTREGIFDPEYPTTGYTATDIGEDGTVVGTMVAPGMTFPPNGWDELPSIGFPRSPAQYIGSRAAKWPEGQSDPVSLASKTFPYHVRYLNLNLVWNWFADEIDDSGTYENTWATTIDTDGTVYGGMMDRYLEHESTRQIGNDTYRFSDYGSGTDGYNLATGAALGAYTMQATNPPAWESRSAYTASGHTFSIYKARGGVTLGRKGLDVYYNAGYCAPASYSKVFVNQTEVDFLPMYLGHSGFILGTDDSQGKPPYFLIGASDLSAGGRMEIPLPQPVSQALPKNYLFGFNVRQVSSINASGTKVVELSPQYLGGKLVWQNDPQTGRLRARSIASMFPPNSGWAVENVVETNDKGLIVGTGFLTEKNENGEPLYPPVRHGFLLMPAEVDRAWSDQLPGVEANWMPNGTGNGNKAYVFMGARADGKAYAKARIRTSAPENVRDMLLWRLAKQNGASYIPAAGSSSLDVTTLELSIVVDNPEAGNYVLVCGLDANHDGQLSSEEIGAMPMCMHDPPGNGVDPRLMPFAFKVVTWSRYQADVSDLIAQADTFYSGLLTPQGGRLLKAFATGAVPVGTTTLPTTIDRVEAGLTHPVGILFSPQAQPGASVEVQFGPNDDLTDAFLASTALHNDLAAILESNRAQVEDWFSDPTHANLAEKEFTWVVSEEASPATWRNFQFLQLDIDMAVALGRVKIPSLTVTALVKRFNLTVDAVTITGNATDIYDFDYDSDVWYFTRVGILPSRAAEVQAGFNTLGVGGKVYKSRILLDDSSPIDFSFVYQP